MNDSENSPVKAPLLLVVYNNRSTLSLLENMVESSEYQIVSASNGSASVFLLNSQQPDLVIIDVMTPEFDSLHVLRTIRDCSTVPIVVLAAEGDIITSEEALSLGADDCIMKPFREREIMARIRAKLRRTNDSP